MVAAENIYPFPQIPKIIFYPEQMLVRGPRQLDLGGIVTEHMYISEREREFVEGLKRTSIPSPRADARIKLYDLKTQLRYYYVFRPSSVEGAPAFSFGKIQFFLFPFFPMPQNLIEGDYQIQRSKEALKRINQGNQFMIVGKVEGLAFPRMHYDFNSRSFTPAYEEVQTFFSAVRNMLGLHYQPSV